MLKFKYQIVIGCVNIENLDIKEMAVSRCHQVGARIKQERLARKWSQSELGDKVAELSGTSNADGRTKSQGNISDWERGARIPSLSDLLCLSKLFNCDLGYLLCDYDSRTHGENEMAAALGLPPEVINTLTTWAKWDVHEYLDALSALVFDARYKTSSSTHRAVLDLINFYFSYSRQCVTKQLWKNGQITDRITDRRLSDSVTDTDGTIDVRALQLSDRTIESAVLVEIQEALRELKHSGCIKQKGDSNGQHTGTPG